LSYFDSFNSRAMWDCINSAVSQFLYTAVYIAFQIFRLWSDLQTRKWFSLYVPIWGLQRRLESVFEGSFYHIEKHNLAV